MSEKIVQLNEEIIKGQLIIPLLLHSVLKAEPDENANICQEEHRCRPGLNTVFWGV